MLWGIAGLLIGQWQVGGGILNARCEVAEGGQWQTGASSTLDIGWCGKVEGMRAVEDQRRHSWCSMSSDVAERSWINPFCLIKITWPIVHGITPKLLHFIFIDISTNFWEQILWFRFLGCAKSPSSIFLSRFGKLYHPSVTLGDVGGVWMSATLCGGVIKENNLTIKKKGFQQVFSLEHRTF